MPSEEVVVLLGHPFRNSGLAQRACTHASAIDDQADARARLASSNERLEFLGDAVLGAAMAEILFTRHPEADEGDLTRRRSRLVNRSALARAFDRHGDSWPIRIGAQMRPPWPDSVKANLVEAALAAIWLDGGWPALRSAVEVLLDEQWEQIPPTPAVADWKSRLQETALASTGILPVYTCSRVGGSDHAPEFTAQVTVGQRSAIGSGGSRRKAETEAAKAWLEHAHTPT